MYMAKIIYIIYKLYIVYKYIHVYVCIYMCLTLCDPMNCSPPGSSVHGIFQARILEQVAMSFSQPRDLPWISLMQGSYLRLLHLLHWQEGALPAEPSAKLIYHWRKVKCLLLSIFLSSWPQSHFSELLSFLCNFEAFFVQTHSCIFTFCFKKQIQVILAQILVYFDLSFHLIIYLEQLLLSFHLFYYMNVPQS